MKSFYVRLSDYYATVARVLKGEADAASIFRNTTDIGMSRELVYAKFLRQHAPSKCNVFFGGYLFDLEGNESAQLDVLVTTDTAPRFDFYNPNGLGKSFSPVEGTLGVVSIKSTLTKKELEETLNGIATIPATASLEGRVNVVPLRNDYDDWPYKVIYASDGISPEVLMGHLHAFYLQNSDIPLCRRPNLIHVAGKYAVLRVVEGIEMRDRTTGKKTDQQYPIGSFQLILNNSDLMAITWVIEALQEKSVGSTHILYSYSEILNKVRSL